MRREQALLARQRKYKAAKKMVEDNQVPITVACREFGIAVTTYKKYREKERASAK